MSFFYKLVGKQLAKSAPKLGKVLSGSTGLHFPLSLGASSLKEGGCSRGGYFSGHEVGWFVSDLRLWRSLSYIPV